MQQVLEKRHRVTKRTLIDIWTLSYQSNALSFDRITIFEMYFERRFYRGKFITHYAEKGVFRSY